MSKGSQDRSYQKGYDDADKPQKDAVKVLFGHGNYQPPSDYEDKKAYDEGWEDRKKDSSGGCFLTIACAEYAGLPHDCAELQTLRSFRDNYLCSFPDGKALVDEYHQIAPLIVQRIKSKDNADAIFDGLLTTLKDVVVLIRAGRNSEAFVACEQEFQMLKNKYA